MRVPGHITIALVLLAVAAGGCTDKPSAAQGAVASPQVTVAKPTKRLIAETDEYVGRFVAVDSVEVRARVAGYLATVHFRDGQLVKEGGLLFTIDRRPFEATLAQAQASLAQAKANLAFATSDLERAQRLVGGAVITQQTFDQRTQKRVAEANVAAQEAVVRQTQQRRRLSHDDRGSRGSGATGIAVSRLRHDGPCGANAWRLAGLLGIRDLDTAALPRH